MSSQSTNAQQNTDSTKSEQKEAKHTIIPGSRRPDGTFRKEIRVREGYTPPDEVAKYESRGKKYVKEVSNMGVVGASYEDEDVKKPAVKKTQQPKKQSSAGVKKTGKATNKTPSFTIEEPTF